jgi:hypothetical protein
VPLPLVFVSRYGERTPEPFLVSVVPPHSERTMNWPPDGAPAVRTYEQVLDKEDLCAVIRAALASTPVDYESLRRGVWTYVGTERHAGVSPGHVIVALTELVEAASDLTRERQSVMRSVILWCVEAYFGHLGGDVMRRDGRALSDTPTAASNH